jgi:hypothetical protein
MVPLRFPSPAESTTFSRARDARVCWLLSEHPVTAAMLVRLAWFPSHRKARKRLRRLCARRQIRLIGTVSRKAAGRPEHVFARFRPAGDSLLHEVELSELCLRLDAGTIRRGPHVEARDLRPDAELWINGRRYNLELDRGSMGYRQIERRFRLYEQTTDVVLWVCSSPERLEGLRRRAKRIRTVALFTTLAEALSTPHGAIWWDYAGNRAALPRDSGDTEKSWGPGPRLVPHPPSSTPAVTSATDPGSCFHRNRESDKSAIRRAAP